MNQVTTVNETMTSTQLAELLGKEKKHIHQAIKAMFGENLDGRNIRPCLDNRGYVIEYIMGELESKMFVAKHDINYLEKITAYWITRNQPKALSPMEMIAAMALNSVKQEKALLKLESQVTTIDSDMQSIKTKVDKIKDLSDQLEFGYVTLKEGYFKYCNVCTYDVFREFANITGLPTKPFNHVPEGTVVIVKTVQVKISDLNKLRNYIVGGATQVSKTLWTHTDLNHRFLLKN